MSGSSEFERDLKQGYLALQVLGWSQGFSHGQGQAPYTFRADARTSDDEEMMVFGVEGVQHLQRTPVKLTLLRGKPEKPDEYGVGSLWYTCGKPWLEDYKGPTEYPDRIPGKAGISGVFWLPEDIYDEIWTQAREHRYDECVIELNFSPVEREDSGVRCWNSRRDVFPSIRRVRVQFERKSNPAAAADVKYGPAPAAPRIYGLPTPLYSMLSLWFAIGVALLIMTLLRHYGFG